MEECRAERAERFAKIWWSSRADAGISQEKMAMGLGVSKKTIQNWEKGTSSPSFFQGLEWFNILGLNPLAYYLEFMYPSRTVENANEDETTKFLMELVANLPMDSKINLCYLLAGKHGSSSHSVLELLMAHLHTPMRDRVTTASVVMQNYEMAKELGTLVNPEVAAPSVEELKTAIEKGKQATINRKDGYVIDEISNL